VQTAAQDEMSFQQGAGVAENLQYFTLGHRRRLGGVATRDKP
jgi:hypothetical protein